MPPPGGHEKDLTWLKITQNRRRMREERKFVEIHTVRINLRLIAARIEEGSLIRSEQRVMFYTIDLRQKRVDMPRIVMQHREFASSSADVEFETPAMEPRVEGLSYRPFEPVWLKVVRYRQKVSIEFGKKFFNVDVAEIRRGVFIGGRKHEIDEFPQCEGRTILSLRQEPAERIWLIVRVQRDAAVSLFEELWRPTCQSLPAIPAITTGLRRSTNSRWKSEHERRLRRSI